MKRMIPVFAVLIMTGWGCGSATAPATPTPSAIPPATSTSTPGTTTTTTTSVPTSTPTTKTPTTATTKPPATKPPTTTTPTSNVTFVGGELALSIVLSAYGAELSWTRAALRDIKGYGIIKSTTDSSPYYPKEFYVHFINDADITRWTDNALAKGKRTYYRICTIGSDDSIKCGNVASVLKP